MQKRFSMGTCAAIVGFASAALFAQAQPPQPPAAAGSGSDQKVTLTGCLRAAPGSSDTAGAAGTAGTTGTTGTTAGATGTSGAASNPSEAQYVLTDATVKPAEAPGSTTPGATTTGAGATTPGTTAAASGAGQTYRLIANPAALTPHVGKKLELTGTLENESASSGAATSGTTATTGAAGSSSAQGPALRVESGKVLAASCSQ
jgi:hypothetical protein